MSETRARKPAIGFIFVTLMLLVLGIGIIAPVIPGLVTEFKGGDVADGSRYYGLLIGCFAFMQFVASPVLGSLSDQFGRRRILLIAVAGTAIDYVITGFAPSLGWMFVARMISGVTAGAIATCNAYIVDVTSPEKRAQAFGIMGAAFGLGFVIGPAMGGILGQVNLRLPFFVAAGFVALNGVYGLFVLPESLSDENRRPFSWRRSNPVGSLLALRRFRGTADLAVMYFISSFSEMMMRNVWILYTGYRYHWTTRDIGLCLTYVGVMAIIVQGGLIRRIIAVTGERMGLVLGLAVSAVCLVCYGLATKGWMIYPLVTVGALAGIAGPSAQALITRHVPADEQGAVQGSLSGIVSLCNIFAPLLAAWAFSKGIPNVPGISLFIASGLTLTALGLALRSFRRDDQLSAASPA